MARHWVTASLSRDYPKLIDWVTSEGALVESRLGGSKEFLNLQLTLLDPQACVVGREGMSERFMMEEILQLLAGVHDNDRLRSISTVAADLITPATAYGPRVRDQLFFVTNELKKNHTSRRAVVYVGRHDDLISINTEKTAGEMPCTETWQFHLRDNRLSMTVNMRSWDLVWGLSYDIPSFVAVQCAVAAHLNAELGEYVHNAGSAHVYERHFNIKTWPTTHVLNLTRHIYGSFDETNSQAYREIYG